MSQYIKRFAINSLRERLNIVWNNIEDDVNFLIHFNYRMCTIIFPKEALRISKQNGIVRLCRDFCIFIYAKAMCLWPYGAHSSFLA